MRISHQMKYNNSMSHINDNLGRYQKAYDEALTGKAIQRPSDDPFGAAKALQLKSALSANTQYERNIGEANLWLDETDQTLNGMVNVMQRVRELAVSGNNGTHDESAREAIAIEMEELTAQLRQFAETKVADRYLLNGNNTAASPLAGIGMPTVGAGGTQTQQDARKITIGSGIAVEVNVTADAIFGTGEEGLFATMASAISSVREGGSIDLDAIDTGINRLLTASSEVGARKNRTEAAENRLADNTLQLKNALSGIENVDLAEALTKLKSEEAVYQASLSASAKIIQPSLMDFLR